MRIGIVPCLDKSAGGVYQYSVTMLNALLKLQKDGEHDDFVIFTDDLENENLFKYKDAGWDIVPLYTTTPFRLFIRKFIKNTPIEMIVAQILSIVGIWSSIAESLPNVPGTSVDYRQRQWFLNRKVDLMIYPASNALSFQTMIPYIFTVHDLSHRIHKEFPEVSSEREWSEREYIFCTGIKHALLVMVDSQVGKEDVLRFYKKTGVSTNRVKILPFLSASYIEKFADQDNDMVRKLFKLPNEYLFYPAQFWPHKNHIRIIKALGMLKEKKKLDIPIVFCGSYSGDIRKKTFDEVMSEAIKLKIRENIFYLGYIEDRYMSPLYRRALALVMPTFFGPTNIPILEAWSLKCPVITSDIRGLKEQAGNAAILVDPKSVTSIADGIYKIWKDDELRRKLVKLGRKRLALYSREDYNKRLRLIIEEAKARIYISK